MSGHWGLLPCWFHQRPGGEDGVAQGGSPGLDCICGVGGLGGAPTHADNILWSENFRPTAVVFVQVVTPGVGGSFFPIEDTLQISFLINLFCSETSSIPDRDVSCLPVK